MSEENRKEVEEIILKAESEEKIDEILKEHGIHMKTDELKAFYQDVKNRRSILKAEVSEEELAAVNGGSSDRDWLLQGCTAAVEPGSSCWRTDGGYWGMNIHYTNMPLDYCTQCGKPGMIEESHSDFMTDEDLKFVPMVTSRRRYHRISRRSCHFCGCNTEVIMGPYNS